MPSPDQEHKSDTTSLDAERARLRSAGYTDAEISQIMIARAAQQPAAAGQGVMSNVLSSILGVASHARALIPTLRKDVETVFDGGATTSARAGAMASLAVKATVVIVLGYAAWQEWRQHIIYAPETAASQAEKAKADACTARLNSYVDEKQLAQASHDCDPNYSAADREADLKKARSRVNPAFLPGQ